MKDDQKLVKSVWPEWDLLELLGSGAFGDVYRARRISFSGESAAAIKIIRIDSGSEGYGLDERQRGTLMESIARDAVREIRTMEALKGYSNIVGIDDHEVVPGKDGKPWYILLRMQLLTPLFADLENGPITEEKVRRIGTDLCRALQACEKHQIVHRDIKPENVFVSDDGVYKLGDFGVARQIETVTNRTRTGTRDFMAPEVYNGTRERADFQLAQRADIYSLGMLLYWLANGRRHPFVRRDGPITADELQEAFRRKISGEPLPPPANVSPALGKAILKACAFKPEDRYPDADAFLQALEMPAAKRSPAAAGSSSSAAPKKHRAGLWIALLLLALALAAGIWLLTRPAPEKPAPAPGPSPTATPTAGPVPGSAESGESEEAAPGREEFREASAGTAAVEIVVDGETSDTGEAAEAGVSAGMAQDIESAESGEALSGGIVIPSLKVGDCFVFGRYEQDNDASNGPEDIVWDVIDAQADRVLLLSRYVLDAHRFEAAGKARSNDFASSELFDWLNEDFQQAAFSQEEQDRLNRGQTDGCPVLLLPAACTDTLPDRLRGGIPTACALARGARTVGDTGLCWWWTAKPYPSNGDEVLVFNSSRILNRMNVSNANGGVRPAVWLPLD